MANSGVAGIRALEIVDSAATSGADPNDAVRHVSDLPSPRPLPETSFSSRRTSFVDQLEQFRQVNEGRLDERRPSHLRSSPSARTRETTVPLPPQKRDLDLNVPTPATVAFVDDHDPDNVYFHLVSNG